MLRLVIILLVLANAGYFAWTQGYLAPLGLAPVEQSEPERLKTQIHPETLRLLNGPGPAPSTKLAAPADETPPAAEASAPTTETRTTPAEAAPAGTATTASPTESATITTSALTPSAATGTTPPVVPTSCWAAYGFTLPQADALRAALAAGPLPREAWQLNEVKLGGRWVVYMGRYTEEQLERKKTELREIGVAFRELTGPLSPGLALGTYSSEAAAQQALADAGKKGVRTARVAQEREETSAWNLRLPEISEAQRATLTSLRTVLVGKRLQRCD